VTLNVALDDAGNDRETGLLNMVGAAGTTRTDMTALVTDPTEFATTAR
jgi:hypothetical protein